MNSSSSSSGPSTPMPAPIPLPPNLPALDLLQGCKEEYIKIGVPLYEASITCNWKAANAILAKRQELIRFAITENYETPLHIAASANSTKSVEEFVENLVNLMDEKDLELQDKNYDTVLSLVAAAGNVKSAMIIAKKNPAVLEIPGNMKMMPLYMAALFARRDMVRYLYDKSNKMSGHFWTNDTCGCALQKCVEADIFDVAIKIVNDRHELTDQKGLLSDVLLALAQKTQAFKERKQHIILRVIKSTFHVKAWHTEIESDALHLLRILWQKISIMPKEEIDDIILGPHVEVDRDGKPIKTYPSGVFFLAAKRGNTGFIIELIRFYPDLVRKLDHKGRTIFHIAIKHRHAKIYNLIYEIGFMKNLIARISDQKGNNMLHLVGKSAKPNQFQNVSGVALQLQRELLWFKEVEQLIPPGYRQRKNEDGKTAHKLFTKEHETLVTEGVKWMRNTSSQCMVVSTLIATIVFIAVLTLPGGYNQDTDIPFSRHKTALNVFVISDATSLMFSSTSFLVFLSFLISGYDERDFLESLPKKLMFGFAMLFLSIVTMVVAFGAGFFVLYNEKLNLTWICLACFAAILIIEFAKLQSHVLRYVFHSIYGSRCLFKPKRRMLYY